MPTFASPLAALRHHVSGAIERGEATAIVAIPAADPAIGTTVSFWDWDDSTGEEIKLTGTVEEAFTDPDDRHPRPSYRVRLASGACHTPYADECRPEVSA